MASEMQGLDEWLNRIREQDMPVFANTVAEIGRLADSETTPVGVLVDVVLRDAAMTSKVLKLANSVFFNPARQSVSTISRAVVLLGFDTVQKMALSVALVESLLKEGVRERAQSEMALAFHAAVQARALAQARRDPAPEETFIAALLYRLGELAFWCFSGETGAALDAALRDPQNTPEAAETRILGFRLQQLTAALVREWRLSPMLQSMFLSGTVRAGSREQAVVLAHNLAGVLAEAGWDAPPARQALQECAAYANVPFATMLRQAGLLATEAARIAESYGAAGAGALIPSSGAAGSEESDEEEDEAAGTPRFDPLLQLTLLREMSQLLQAHPEPGPFLDLALRGMREGVGVERALFATLTPDRRWLRARSAVGRGRRALLETFQFSMANTQGMIPAVLEQRKPFHIDDPDASRYAAMLGERLRAVADGQTFMIAPIVVNGSSIGLFYADRPAGEGGIGEEMYQSFLLFVQQASLGLEHLNNRNNRTL